MNMDSNKIIRRDWHDLVPTSYSDKEYTTNVFVINISDNMFFLYKCNHIFCVRPLFFICRFTDPPHPFLGKMKTKICPGKIFALKYVAN
jgi:hypothetical protein